MAATAERKKSNVDAVLSELEVLRAKNALARQALEAEKQRARKELQLEKNQAIVQASKELRKEFLLLKRLDEEGWECDLCNKRNAFQLQTCAICLTARPSDDSFRVRVSVVVKAGC